MKPISSRTIMMMPNHTASNPNATTSGKGIGRMMIITDSSSRAQAIARSTALMKYSENEPVLFAKRRSAEPLRLTDAAAKDRHRPAARDVETSFTH